mgnify:CR=1 FL=1
MEGRDGRVDFGKNIDIYRHKGDDSLAFDPIQLDTVALKAIQDSLKAVEGIVIEQDSVVQPGSK